MMIKTKTTTAVPQTCCFSGDTLILMADGSTKRIDEVKIGDVIMTTDDSVQEVGCDCQNDTDTYFILTSSNAHELEITGAHPVCTDRGWIQVKHLSVGDKIKYVSTASKEEQYEEITSIEIRNESRMMYNLICEDKPIIANGFVCSDFHMQYKMELIENIKKKK